MSEKGDLLKLARKPIGRSHPVLAQLVPLGAAALQWVLWPMVHPLYWIFFYPAVFVSSWIGGLAGGIIATLLSTLVVLFLFIPPAFSFSVEDPKAYLSAVVFLCMGGLFSWVHHRLRKAGRLAEAALAEAVSARDHLEEQVRERTKDLKRAHDLLLDSDEVVRLLISEVKDYAIFMLDVEGHVTSWNEGADRIKGYKAEEILGKHFSVFYPEEDQRAGKPDRELKEALESGHYTEEGVRVRKDGSAYWASVVITPMRDRSGKLRGFSKVTKEITQRKRIEQELRTLAAVAQNSKDFIGVCTPDMKGVFVNEAGLRMVGMDSQEDVRRTDVIDYFWPEDRRMILEEAVPVLLREGSWRGEVRFRHFKTGEPIHTVWDAFAIRDEAGKVAGYATISPNLERMKRLQEALSEADHMLQESLERHAGIVASAMDAIITVNNDQKIVVFNEAAEKMFRCTAAQALGQSIEMFIPQRFRDAHGEHIRKFGEAGATSRAMGTLNSLWALRTTGEEFPIEASISKMKTNGKKLFSVIIRDVTERVKAEEAIRRSDATRTIALESAQLGEWQIDLQTGVATGSLMHANIFGYPERPPKWNFDIFLRHVHPEDREKVQQAFKESVDTGKKWDFECRIVRTDNETRWIWACGSHYKDQSGKPSHVMGTVADITGRKRAEEMRLRSQKLEGLGTLAGGISHDFNNILLAISGNAKLAAGDLPADHPAQESLAEITKGANRAAELVRRILAFSRPQELKQASIQLSSLVEEALKLLRATIPANIEFQTEFEAGIPPVLVDATQIHQVIVNLAVNGAHAIGAAPGSLRFSLRSFHVESPVGRELIDIPEGDYVQLTVRDTGCGMDRRTLDRIFDPFFTTKAPGEGTGLGLSVVHGIITNHGGAIRVYSERGKGTVFHLYFPAAQVAMPEAAQKAGPAGARQRNEHVLYVDDEEGLVLLATRLLKRLGYRVTGFTSPNLALDAFRGNPAEFDAVVTDLSMPHLSGFDLAEQILAIRPDIPVIVSSGYVRAEDQENAKRIGVHQMIQKPYTLEQLQETFDLYFARATAPAESPPR